MDSVVQIARLNVATTTNNLFEYALFRNPTLTGGTIVRRGFLAGSNQNNAATDLEIDNGFDLQLGRTNADSPVSDVYCLGIRTVSSTGDAIGSIQWHELI